MTTPLTPSDDRPWSHGACGGKETTEEHAHRSPCWFIGRNDTQNSEFRAPFYVRAVHREHGVAPPLCSIRNLLLYVPSVVHAVVIVVLVRTPRNQRNFAVGARSNDPLAHVTGFWYVHHGDLLPCCGKYEALPPKLPHEAGELDVGHVPPL